MLRLQVPEHVVPLRQYRTTNRAVKAVNVQLQHFVQPLGTHDLVYALGPLVQVLGPRVGPEVVRVFEVGPVGGAVGAVVAGGLRLVRDCIGVGEDGFDFFDQLVVFLLLY